MSFADRIRETVTFTGTKGPTADITLPGSASTGYDPFSRRYTNGTANIPVVIAHRTADEWQACLCTYTTTNTLTVNSIVATSDAADAAVNFSNGDKDIYVSGLSTSFLPPLTSGQFVVGNASNVPTAVAPEIAASRIGIFDCVKAFSNQIDVEGATIPSTIDHIRTAGYYQAGDGGGALYKRVSGTPASPSNKRYITSSGSVYWDIAEALPNVKQFGAKGDGTGINTGTVDTTAIQDAITFAQGKGGTLYIPAGQYRVQAKLEINSGLSLIGDTPGTPVANATGTAVPNLSGSWLYFDHTGVGIEITTASGVAYTSPDNVMIEKLGTYRNQPAPSAGVAWTPNSHDYDIRCYLVSDTVLRDVFMLNPTKGVLLTGDATLTAGRLEIDQFRAGAFQRGITVEVATDVVRLHNVHIWPYWRDGFNTAAGFGPIKDYTIENLNAIALDGRCDNPLLSNIFTIAARAGLFITQTALGKVSKVHVVNADFDLGKYGILIDASCTNGVDCQFENITCANETGVTGAIGLLVQGDNCKVQFGNFENFNARANAVRIEGDNNYINFSNVVIKDWNQSGAGFPAIEDAGTDNIVSFGSTPVVTGGGGAPTFSGPGICNFHNALTVLSRDSGTGLGPTIDLHRRSASPADDDVIGGIRFYGRDSASNEQLYATIDSVIVDEGSGSEDSRLRFTTTVAGSATVAATIEKGMILGSPTSGDKGVGTLNATNLYVNNTLVPLPNVATTWTTSQTFQATTNVANLANTIGTSAKYKQTAGTAHAAANVGSMFFGIDDGGNECGVFVHNTHDGTYSSQDVRLFTAEGGVSAATERLRVKKQGQVRFVPLTGDPAGAEDGDVYYNSSTNKLRVRANGSWVDLH